MNSKKQGDSENAETFEKTFSLTTQDLKKSLLYFFAMDRQSLEDVLRSNFITDYSALVADPAVKHSVFRELPIFSTSGLRLCAWIDS